MGRVWRDPVTGAIVDEFGTPVTGRPGVHWRSPVVEQTLAQAGGALARQGRPMTPHELAVARPIFGSSIVYEAVRVVQADVLNAPTTLGNWIRIDGRLKRDGSSRFDDVILVHELTHVWQYQTQGTSYMSDSFCGQIEAIVVTARKRGLERGRFELGDRVEAYTAYTSQLSTARSIHDFSVERQARVVELYLLATRMRHEDPKQREEARQLAAQHRLLSCMTDPLENEALFQEEYLELQRLVAAIPLARSLGAVEIYTEGLGVQSNQRLNLDTGQAPLSLSMPLFRIDF